MTLTRMLIGLIVFIAQGIPTSETPRTHMNSAMISLDSLKTYLALGDSYTIGQSVNEHENYPAQTVAILQKQGIGFRSPEIVATTGWTTGDLQNAMGGHQFAFRMYDIVTLLIGVNNQYQERTQTEYASQFRELLQDALRLAGNRSSHVIVLSIPDYSATPVAKNSDTSRISAEINAFNRINKMISEQYRVNYLDITQESRNASSDLSLIAVDNLHYSGKEYALWAAMLASVIKDRLQ